MLCILKTLELGKQRKGSQPVQLPPDHPLLPSILYHESVASGVNAIYLCVRLSLPFGVQCSGFRKRWREEQFYVYMSFC